MTRNIFSWATVAVAAWLLTGPAFSNSTPGAGNGKDKGKEEPPPIRGVASREKLGRQLEGSFDAGDFYVSSSGKRRLLRLPGAIVIQAKPEPQTKESLNQLSSATGPLKGYTAHHESRSAVTFLQAPRTERERQARDPRIFRDALSKVRRANGVVAAHPVFVEPETGLVRILTGEILISLRPGTDPKSYFGSEWPRVRPLRGAPENFLLIRSNATTEALFAEANRRAADRRVAWAQPNFLSQMVKQTSDPFYAAQWPLHNAGLNGASANADVNAPGAWATTPGNSSIVIAVLDDGVDVNHPDLAGTIFTNSSETSNAVDDDGNGYVDDLHGWDFFGNDNDPSPELAEDMHGTAIAGIIAAVANNNQGIAGVAYGCRIMPVKISCGGNWVSDSTLAEAIYYAAGRTRDGLGTWRGADVLNISLSFPQSAVVDGALQWAATNGRGGKGCPIFVAAGDDASRWRPTRVRLPVGSIVGPGQFRFGFEYSKDVSMSVGEDLARIDNVTLLSGDGITQVNSAFGPGGRQDFEGTFPPSGWQLLSSLASPLWFATTTGANTGAGGITSAQSGPLANGNWTEIRTPLVTLAGDEWLSFSCYIASETDYDGLKIWVYDANGNYVSVFAGDQDAPMLSGNQVVNTALHYPASHPAVFAIGASTDNDRRADYSAYGAGLEFLAPSSGGWNDVITTDLTGADGYESGDYVHDFGGTSAASPLAAGVCALMLSVDPALKISEVRGLMRESCDKVGGVTYDSNGWNDYYGYGRVNAQRAVASARAFGTDFLRLTVTPTGTEMLPGSSLTYTLIISNRSSITASGIVVTNVLAPGVTFASSSLFLSPGSAGQQQVYQLGDLASGAHVTISIIVIPPAIGTFTNLTTIASTTTDPTTTATVVSVVPALTISDGTVTEGNAGTTNATFNIRLSARSSQPVTVNFSVAGGSAVPGFDYVPVNGMIVFPPGSTNQVLRVPVIGDRLSESNLTFFVSLAGPVNAMVTRGQALGMILDNRDPVPAILIEDVTVTEGDNGTASAVFDVRLSTRSGRPITVQYATANGSATANTDYLPSAGIVTFAPGMINQTITIAVLGDTLSESNETFFVNLSNPVNATLSKPQARGTILDDDPLPLVRIDNTSVVEGNSGTTNAVFTVSLSTASGMPVSVNYSTAPGSATAARDYRAVTGVLKFTPGTTSQTIQVPVIGDTLSESNETFFVNLSRAVNANIVTAQGVGTILDDDTLPSLSINDSHAIEANAGARALAFNVRLSAPSGRMVTVNYSTADGTAFAGSDYVVTNGTLVFAPGAVVQTVRVPVIGNTTSESNEVFLVNLSLPVNATIADGQAIGTIIDNDRVPALVVNDISVAEGNNGSTNAVFTVRLSAASGRLVSVGWTTSNHTAHAGVDYQGSNGILMFEPGVTNQPIVVPVIGDAARGTNRDFYVLLTNAANATIARPRGVCTILDDDFIATTTFHPASDPVTTNVMTDFKISSARIVGTNVVITFPTFAGRSVLLEYCDSPLGLTSVWQPVPGATNIVGTGDLMMATHFGGVSQTMRFYRGRLLP